MSEEAKITAADIERLEREADCLRVESNKVRQQWIDAEQTLREAKLIFAQQNPHPMVGKKVQKKVLHGWSQNARRTLTGVVTLYDPKLHRSVRSLPWRIKPGDVMVLSLSGKTAYSFGDYWQEIVK
jgi:hypothetical protein